MPVLTILSMLLAVDYTAFHADREKEINSDEGWITLVGFHWLKQGENRVGSDPSSEVPLPEKAPKQVGAIVLNGKQATFRPAPNINLKAGPLRPDRDVLALGRIKFFLIEREGKLAVRVKDKEAPARKEFTGLKWYPIDPAWRIQAKFTAFAERHTITFDTMAGVKEQMESPGYATFRKDGREFRLDPVSEEHRLFFVFRDQTSGKSTYGGARFLYADAPKNGVVVLDFNEAINPPCVFTPYATCPLPPPQNRLPIDVKAGELMYGQNNHVYP
jgi:uncharacterized protein (DUF1684 family)